MGYSSRRQHCLPLLSAENRELRIAVCKGSPKLGYRRLEKLWSDDFQTLLQRWDTSRIWHKPYEKPRSILSCIKSSEWWCNCDIFCLTVDPLLPIEHLLNVTAYLNIDADHVNPSIAKLYPTVTKGNMPS